MERATEWRAAPIERPGKQSTFRDRVSEEWTDSRAAATMI